MKIVNIFFVEIAFLEPKFNFKWSYCQNFSDFLPRFGATALFHAREGRPRHPDTHNMLTQWPISPEPVEVQISNLKQIVALNMLMKKGEWVHESKFDSLGAGSQNDNSPPKMHAFLTGLTSGRQKFSLFYSKTLVWDPLATFKPVPSCPPDIIPV